MFKNYFFSRTYILVYSLSLDLYTSAPLPLPYCQFIMRLIRTPYHVDLLRFRIFAVVQCGHRQSPNTYIWITENVKLLRRRSSIFPRVTLPVSSSDHGTLSDSPAALAYPRGRPEGWASTLQHSSTNASFSDRCYIDILHESIDREPTNYTAERCIIPPKNAAVAAATLFGLLLITWTAFRGAIQIY